MVKAAFGRPRGIVRGGMRGVWAEFGRREPALRSRQDGGIVEPKARVIGGNRDGADRSAVHAETRIVEGDLGVDAGWRVVADGLGVDADWRVVADDFGVDADRRVVADDFGLDADRRVVADDLGVDAGWRVVADDLGVDAGWRVVACDPAVGADVRVASRSIAVRSERAGVGGAAAGTTSSATSAAAAGTMAVSATHDRQGQNQDCTSHGILQGLETVPTDHCNDKIRKRKTSAVVPR